MVVKAFILFFFLSSFIFSSSLNNQIKNIIGDREYSVKKNLINVIFKNKYSFLDQNERINFHKVFNTLYNNSFNYTKRSKSGFNVSFETTSNVKVLLSSVVSVFAELGLEYKILNSVKEMDYFKILLMVKNKKFNLKRFEKELFKRDIILKEILSSGNNLSFKMDLSKAKFSAEELGHNRYIHLKKPRKDYFLQVNRTTKISLVSHPRNNWYPHITFYDKNLNILWTKKVSRRTNKLTLKVAPRSSYIKVGDMFNLANLNHGLKVMLNN